MKILLCWELGRNFGHAVKLIKLGEAFHKKGAEIFIAAQNPSVFQSFESAYPFTLLQAPYAPVKPVSGPILSFTDDLRPCGYLDSKMLVGMIQAWQGLYDIIKPDVIVLQAAPTALLAARDRDIIKAEIGGGYDLPPVQVPFPLIRYWDKIEESVIEKRESQVLDVINSALDVLKLPRLDSCSNIFDKAHRFLTTFQELDHYPTREGSSYYGTLFENDSGTSLKWRKDAKKKIFAYLRPGTKSFNPAFQSLITLPDSYDVIIAAPGIPKAVKEKHESAHIGIEDGSVKMNSILPACDLAVCHAGIGFSSACLLQGVPLLLLPGHVEQLMFARAVGRMGAGRGLIGEFGPDKVRELLDTLLEDSEFKKSAQSFAKKYKDFTPEKVCQKICDEILALVKSNAKKENKKKRA